MGGPDPGDESLDALPITEDRPRRRSSSPAPTRRGAHPLVIAVAIGVLGVVAANLLLGGDDGTEEAAGDDEPAALEDPSAVSTDVEVFETSFDQLVDGQTVPVRIDGLPFSTPTVTLTCLADPTGVVESLLDECDSGTAQRRTSSPGGVIETELRVSRSIAVAGFRRLDCVRVGCELRTYSSGGGDVVWARVGLGWNRDEPDPGPGAQIRVEYDQQLRQGQAFTVAGNDLPPDTSIHIRPCWLGLSPDPFECEWILADWVIQTDANGRFAFETALEWEIGFGPDAITCAEIEDGLCAVTVGIPGADRQPAAVPLDIEPTSPFILGPELPEQLIVEPSTALADGDVVTVSTEDGPYDGELGLSLCPLGLPQDCAWLDFAGPVDGDVGRYELPRSFVTQRGTRHDCLTDSPCAVTIIGFRGPQERIETEVGFDPELGLTEPLALRVSPTEALQNWALITLEVDDAPGYPLISLCATGSRERCQSIGFDDTSGTTLVTRARSTIVTPAGRHNCLLDGPCEVVLWDAANLARYETVPLTFAAVDQEPLTAVVRPRSGLRHGDTAQVAIANAVDGVAISACVVGVDRCAPILLTTSDQGRGVAEFTVLQQFEVVEPDGQALVIDCVEVDCEIRASDGWSTTTSPLVFASDSVAPPPPELAVNIDGTLPVDELFTIRGRGFTPTVHVGEVDIVLCPPWASLMTSCVNVGFARSDQFDGAGEFTTRANIASSSFTTGFENSMDRCSDECDLVARPRYGLPARLPIVRDLE